MRNLGQALAVAAALAISASPVYAGVAEWSWNWTNECGGSNFETCMSGSIEAYWDNLTSTATILVEVRNDSPYLGDLFTAVGLANLPAGYTPTITANDLSNWSVAPNYNGINGDLPPETYAINAENGSNYGFSEDGIFHSFTFTFSGVSLATLQGWEDEVIVGIQAQRGPNGCSTKMGVNSEGAVDNSDLGEYEQCLSVPEPGSMALLASGAVGMAFVVRRRRNGVELVDEDGNDVEI